MRYYVGADGGGTKTAFAAAGPDGRVLTQFETKGTSYKQYGLAAVVERAARGVDACLERLGAGRAELAGCCLGMPCYGENSAQDARLRERLEAALAPAPVYVCNDVEVGWAGSLGGRPGIDIVAGTGSIAFGRDPGGRGARCGGWCELFGDEGSCYWIGRRTMELFSKQADGRIPRGALYGLVRAELGITEDFGFMDLMERDYAPSREKVASLQRLTERAARAGDGAAADLYRQAADELALIIRGVKAQLSFPGPVEVSYTGGLFRAGELILAPLSARMEEAGCVLRAPLATPLEGAVWLAVRRCQETTPG